MIVVKIDLKGAIVTDGQKHIYNWLEIPAVAPKDIKDALPESNEDVELIVNSNGGIVNSGSEIYTMLKEYPGKVTAKVVGMAASAASVVVMAADTVQISPTARIMIHNAWSSAEGDHRAMETAKESVTSADKGIRNAYMQKTNLSEEEITELMNKETYMDAEKAVELGFADEIMFQNKPIDVAASLEGGLLPESIIDKVRNVMLREEKNQSNDILKRKALMEKELKIEEIENSLK